MRHGRFASPIVVTSVVVSGAALAAVACATVTDQPDATDAPWDTGADADAAGDVDPGDDGAGEVAPDTAGDACPPGTSDCSGACVDLMTDEDNCQWCGNACPDTFEHATGVCEGGVCGWECATGWADADGLPGCETACPAGGTETCNGMDDDCDGNADDGFPCRLGDILACTTVCSTFGTGTCTFPCVLPTAESCVPPAEACNGIDDDCDDLTDEDWPPGTCSSCTPDCSGRECGPDPACETSCGSCTFPEACSAAGVCGCTPDCSGRECGTDPACGTSCGTCTPPESCIATGDCVCYPACGGMVCGTDPICGESCGTCTAPLVCNAMGQCVSCAPDCSGLECGPDPVCGTSCGACTAPDTCGASGTCVPPGCPPPTVACSTGSESRDRCAGARTIGRPAAAGSGGYQVSDSTCYAYNRFDDSCWDAGADHAYRIYLLAGETMSVYTYADWACSTYSDTWWDLTLKIIQNSGCSDTACTTRVVCEEYISTHTETFTAPQDGWYFIVVDGTTAFDDEGDYDLRVNLTCAHADCGC